MDIKSWKIMLAVDDYGSFTRVGAELGYTQSGITQMMKNLEKKVGFPLYIKDHHGITLTNEAKSLIPAIRTLLNADEVIKEAQSGSVLISAVRFTGFQRSSVNSNRSIRILSSR